MGRIGPTAKEAVPALIIALEDESWRVRPRAAQALGEIGSAAKEAVPALITALKDRLVRDSAVFALGKIGAAAIPALHAAARDGIHGAESALKEIRGER